MLTSLSTVVRKIKSSWIKVVTLISWVIDFFVQLYTCMCMPIKIILCTYCSGIREEKFDEFIIVHLWMSGYQVKEPSECFPPLFYKLSVSCRKCSKYISIRNYLIVQLDDKRFKQNNKELLTIMKFSMIVLYNVFSAWFLTGIWQCNET